VKKTRHFTYFINGMRTVNQKNWEKIE